MPSFARELETTLHNALAAAAGRKHEYATLEHLLLALIDAIPALAAGCAALIKPSEVTPRFIPELRKTIAGIPELAAVVA